MAAKSLKIDSLDLDLENPRIKLATDQRDAMQKILNEQKVKLINLGESIASKGLNPMDWFLIIRSHLRSGKFIVLEGNRRLLASKMLKNPALISSLHMPEPFAKRLQRASHNFDKKKIARMDCFEVMTRAEGIDWIRQRHNREDGGRGIVPLAGLRGHVLRRRNEGPPASWIDHTH